MVEMTWCNETNNNYANFFSNACITSTNAFTLSSGSALYKDAR